VLTGDVNMRQLRLAVEPNGVAALHFATKAIRVDQRDLTLEGHEEVWVLLREWESLPDNEAGACVCFKGRHATPQERALRTERSGLALYWCSWSQDGHAPWLHDSLNLILANLLHSGTAHC
jgi:hypothetical protein